MKGVFDCLPCLDQGPRVLVRAGRATVERRRHLLHVMALLKETDRSAVIDFAHVSSSAARERSGWGTSASSNTSSAALSRAPNARTSAGAVPGPASRIASDFSVSCP